MHSDVRSQASELALQLASESLLITATPEELTSAANGALRGDLFDETDGLLIVHRDTGDQAEITHYDLSQAASSAAAILGGGLQGDFAGTVCALAGLWTLKGTGTRLTLPHCIVVNTLLATPERILPIVELGIRFNEHPDIVSSKSSDDLDLAIMELRQLGIVREEDEASIRLVDWTLSL